NATWLSRSLALSVTALLIFGHVLRSRGTVLRLDVVRFVDSQRANSVLIDHRPACNRVRRGQESYIAPLAVQDDRRSAAAKAALKSWRPTAIDKVESRVGAPYPARRIHRHADIVGRRQFVSDVAGGGIHYGAR